ncbi:transglycosylase SLT domain-containing protein [Nocardia sp. NPDC046763]|uniref:transglycosylase SLT domain-containing protein n=1 Tax=Nocardia sp. NPDC046763 TaxID=3155256 RepID=UPI0033D41697
MPVRPTALPVPHPKLRTPAARTASALALAVTAAAVIATAAGHDTATTALQPPTEPTTTEPSYQPGLMVPVPTAEPSTTPPIPPAELVSDTTMPVQELRPAPDQTPPAPAYPDNLDGWIRNSLDVMTANGIPGSYDGILRNVMRESGGDPHAINLYDSNAAMGIPSKGLLQVIDPTFNAYHVEGTVFDIWDPVANIVAACNYAAHRYGSIDNVFSAY